ncbi:MAG TPA: caspase family protein, partial [Pyrinomonadaceae bacterium]|nr:caspase family protein [Pyrinomonadaceae bacterium]
MLSFSFIVGGARAQSVTPQASGAQDQRGIRVKQDGQKTDERANQATPADEKARAARPELVLQTGYALFGPSGLRFSPDGRLLATFSTFGGSQVKLWDAATGHELRTLAVSAGGAFFGGGGVTAVAFSRDGRLIAAGSTDGSSRVWDVSTGRELYRLGGGDKGTGFQAVHGLAFGPDGHTLVALGPLSAKFWDLSTGQLAHEMEGVTTAGAFFNSLALTPDGTQVLLSLMDAEKQKVSIKFVDIATGNEARTVESPQTPGMAGGLTITPDGRLLSTFEESAGGARQFKLYDISAQKGHKLFDLPEGKYASASFSPDGRLLATVVGNNVRLWDTTTGGEVRTLDLPNQTSKPTPDTLVIGVAFSPDSRLLATSGSDTRITLLDVSTGRPVRTLAGRVNYAYEAAFNSDGTRLLTGGKTIWDVSTGRGLRAMAADSSGSLAQLSRDGRVIVERAFGGNKVELYDAQSHKLLYTLAPAEQAEANQVVLSPDGRFAVTTYRLSDEQQRERAKSASNAVRVNQKEITNAMRDALKKGQKDPNAIMRAYSQALAGASGAQPGIESQVKVWDTSTGGEVRTFTIPPDNPLAPNTIDRVAFSADGRTLAANASGTGSVILWDLTTGRKAGELGASAQGTPGMFAGAMFGNGESVSSLTFSPDGRFLAVGGKLREGGFDPMSMMGQAATRGSKRPQASAAMPDAQQMEKQIIEGMKVTGTIKIFNVSNGQELISLKGGAGDVQALAFSVDGRTLATASADNTIKLWDATTGDAVRSLADEGESVTSLAFSPDGRLLASTSNEGSTALWDAKTGARLATLVSVGDGGDWLVVTPDGLFDGSPAAWDQILWRFGGNTFNVEPVETFFNEFFYPGLLSDIVAGKRPAAPRDIAVIDRRQPAVALKSSAGETTSSRTVAVSIELTDAPAGAKDVRLFRNGLLVKVWHGDVLKGQSSATLEATVPVVAGENRFTAYAFNNDNVKSHDAALVVNGADSLRRAGTAYVVAVGINSYENAQYNLRYAAADAQDFADELKRQQAQLGKYESVEVVPLMDSDATKANILAALKILAGDAGALPANAPKSLAQLKPAQPEDTVVVYFAGHGTAQSSRFYLIPHDMAYAGGRDELDAAGLRTILAHSISDEELQSAVEGLDAGQLLLVIDACNSGQALEAEEKRRGPMNSKGLAQLAYEKGMYILTAAQSYQA